MQERYECGHEHEPVIIDNNEISISAYFEWLETAGAYGDKSLCFKCWCKKNDK